MAAKKLFWYDKINFSGPASGGSGIPIYPLFCPQNTNKPQNRKLCDTKYLKLFWNRIPKIYTEYLKFRKNWILYTRLFTKKYHMPELKWPEIPYTQNPWPGLVFSNHVCYCGAVVKELLAYAYKPGSTPGDAVFCFFVPVFFSLWSLFLTLVFLKA